MDKTRELTAASVEAHARYIFTASENLSFRGSDMRIPPFDRQHVLRALDHIRKHGVPDGRGATKFAIVHDGHSYPPKYVLQLAVKFATSQDLDPRKFYPDEANRHLAKHGFHIRSVTGEPIIASPLKTRPIEATTGTAVTLNENEVVDAVCRYLETKGYEILRRALTTERGVDVQARSRRTNHMVLVEAKGGISSKPGTRAYGKVFDKGKVSHQVAQGLFTTMHLRAKHPGDVNHIALAVPDNGRFRSCLDPIHNLVNQLDISVLLVRPDGEVMPLGRDLLS